MKRRLVLTEEAKKAGFAGVYDIQWDGITVWVNSPTAMVGRFGRYGIDIHRLDQIESGVECLLCTHGATTAEDWSLFVTKMLEIYRVQIPSEAIPARFVRS